MTLRGSIDRLASGNYTVTRYASSTTDGHGRAVAGAITTFPMRASIQPLMPQTNMDYSEGQIADETVKIFTRTRLVAEDVDAGITGDTFVRLGRTYRVSSVATWQSFGQAHYECTATYVGPDTAP